MLRSSGSGKSGLCGHVLANDRDHVRRAPPQRYGTNYLFPGWDGVHPDWAGHAIMAYAFLKAFRKGSIADFRMDLASGTR